MIWPIDDGTVRTRDGRHIPTASAPWWARTVPAPGVRDIELDVAIRRAAAGYTARKRYVQACKVERAARAEVRRAMDRHAEARREEQAALQAMVDTL